MKKVALICFALIILASSTFAADVEYTFIDASCDEEGRAIFYFIIEYEESFKSSEARIRGIEGEWYDCAEAHCSYNYYDQPPGVLPKGTINTGREYMLITEPLTFNESKTYDLDFVYPTEVDGGVSSHRTSIHIPLECTGYDFSCSLYDFEVDKCISGDGTFRIELTAEGINQPHKLSLINDFRYRLVGEKTTIEEDRPLNEASVQYMKKLTVTPSEARILGLGKGKYAIEFPYHDIAKWLSVFGKYCRHDNDRFGESSNFEFLQIKKCDVRQFIVTPAKDEPEEPPEAPRTTKFYPVPKKETAPKEPAQVAAEEPEETVPKREITFFAVLRVLLELFKR